MPPPVDPAIWSAAEVRVAVRRRHFGELIRAYRFLAGEGRRPLPQERVASWLGITQPQLSRVETGPAVNDLSRLVRWATTLAVPAELLWFRIDDAEGPADPDGQRPVGTGRAAPGQSGRAGRPPVGRPVSRPVALSSLPSLRIGIVAPPWLPVPPPMYGGTELVIDTLARGLAQRGHEVVLFATGDSTCPVKRSWVYNQAVPAEIGATAIELNHTAAAWNALAGCDVVHDSTLAGLFIGQLHPRLPAVTTNHGPFVPLLADVYRHTAHKVPLIAISKDQARSAPEGVPIAAIIHHGIDLERYPFSPASTTSDYVACLARMTPDKGIDQAIRVARRAGIDLKIAAKMREPAERAYYEGVIEPLLGGGVDYIGEADHQTKIELLAGARALLNPIRWPEPFGLVTIEALACGTPVIGTPRGALPELVEDGVTGYLATSIGDLAGAIAAADRIDRRTCRQHAESRFTMQHMTNQHEALYRRVIHAWTANLAGETGNRSRRDRA
jgi:glycosyltransferase involved in cell wall biosynthesis/transcriptional regulator with XRE-family HTH domain